MNYIDKVKIDGFWGDKSIEVNFNKDINFLIGVNGSGKTTFINLVAATLQLDFKTLDRLQYDKIHVRLKSFENKKFKPYVEIEKKRSELSPYPEIIFRIKASSNQKLKEYPLNDIEEENLFRYRSEISRIRRSRFRRDYDEDIYNQLSELVNLNWLSIQRIKSGNNRDDSFESSIDQKITELNNSFLRYFSLLQRRASEEAESFQKFIFLSLLSDETQEELFKVLGSVNSKDEKSYLREIFSEFRLPERMYSKKLESHFESYEKSISKVESKEPLDLNDLSFLIGTRRIHGVVQKWSELVTEQKSIFKYRDIFLEVVNGLLSRKKLIFSERNELIIKTDSGKKFPLHNLSSGEKQLIIILGESLLQQSTPHVYIADEPELSLHVAWQEKLVSSLKAINPNSQIVFATHSPDIVSSYGDSVINIEKHIK